MGCLNEHEGHDHYFGNIHLSGPCNRSCYFCIGQYMPGLDPLNNLDKWPLDGIDEFIEECKKKGTSEVNLTGTNTDPMLYKHLPELKTYLKERMPNLVFGVRTNGVTVLSNLEKWHLFDKGSISFPSFDPDIYEKMMGSRDVPNLLKIKQNTPWPLKINVVLSPYNIGENGEELKKTLLGLQGLGIKVVNLREPYGQPHIGDPLAKLGFKPVGIHLGMPVYEFKCISAVPMLVIWWDVHFCLVASVNLYASGRVSLTYPITKGYAPEGKVIPQSEWGTEHKRHFEQWVGSEQPAWRSMVED